MLSAPIRSLPGGVRGPASCAGARAPWSRGKWSEVAGQLDPTGLVQCAVAAPRPAGRAYGSMGDKAAACSTSGAESVVVEDGVYIVSAARTPMGSFQGSLARFTATELGAHAIRGALQRAGIPADSVEEVFFGNVISAGLGQAPARQAALAAGLPTSADCTSVNKVCASGLKAAALAVGACASGVADVVVAAGAESMSCAPHLLAGARGASVPRLGDGTLPSSPSRSDAGASPETLADTLLRDGLVDAGSGRHMGEFAEQTASHYGIDRSAQDGHAAESWARALAARDAGELSKEIVPIQLPPVDGEAEMQVLASDEPLGRYNPEKMRTLKPAFVADGTVTAANASPLTDGAAALVFATGRKVIEEGWQPLARVVASADAAQEPEWFTTSPAMAIQKLLKRAKLDATAIDCYEINEAFSVVDLVNRQLLDLPPDRVNVHGGAVALGHPIGASGARILVTLCHVLRARKGRYGVAAICNGGGGASAMLIERMETCPTTPTSTPTSRM